MRKIIIISFVSIIVLFSCEKQIDKPINVPVKIFDQIAIAYVFEGGTLKNIEELDTINEDYYWIVEPINSDSFVVYVFTNRDIFISGFGNTTYGPDLIEMDFDMNLCREYALENSIDPIYEATNEISHYFWNFLDSVENIIQTRSFFQLFENVDGSGDDKVCCFVPNPSLGNFCNKASSFTGLFTSPGIIFCDYKWWGGRKVYFLPGAYRFWDFQGVKFCKKADSYWS